MNPRASAKARHIRVTNSELSIRCDHCGKHQEYPILGAMTLDTWKETLITFRRDHKNCKPLRAESMKPDV